MSDAALAGLPALQWLLAGIGLVLLLEGVLYALLPRTLQLLMRQAQGMPPRVLRRFGLMAFLLGALLLWVSVG